MTKAAASSLVLYMPGLHNGYLALFEKCRGSCDRLYILGEWICDEFPLLKREIRAVKPEVMQKAVTALGYFKEVLVADRAALASLNGSPVLLSHEYISDYLAENYLADSRIKRETVFLRFDEKMLKSAYGETAHQEEITEDEFHRSVMRLAIGQTDKVSDWFRQIGAALVRDGKVMLLSHINRMPAPHDHWLIGDPRMYLEYGSDTSLRTTLHAEQALIAAAARKGIPTEGASIYTTTYPCPDCSNTIVEAGITTCYFKDGYAALNSADILKACGVKTVKVIV